MYRAVTPLRFGCAPPKRLRVRLRRTQQQKSPVSAINDVLYNASEVRRIGAIRSARCPQEGEYQVPLRVSDETLFASLLARNGDTHPKLILDSREVAHVVGLRPYEHGGGGTLASRPRLALRARAEPWITWGGFEPLLPTTKAPLLMGRGLLHFGPTSTEAEGLWPIGQGSRFALAPNPGLLGGDSSTSYLRRKPRS